MKTMEGHGNKVLVNQFIEQPLIWYQLKSRKLSCATLFKAHTNSMLVEFHHLNFAIKFEVQKSSFIDVV